MAGKWYLILEGSNEGMGWTTGDLPSWLTSMAFFSFFISPPISGWTQHERSSSSNFNGIVCMEYSVVVVIRSSRTRSSDPLCGTEQR